MRLNIEERKALELFATLHHQGLWAQLLIPTAGYAALVDASALSALGELRGWIVQLPPSAPSAATSAATSTTAAAASAAALPPRPSSASPAPSEGALTADAAGAAPEAQTTLPARLDAAALAAAITDPSRFESMAAKLAGDARVLMDGLRRKMTAQAPHAQSPAGGAPPAPR